MFPQGRLLEVPPLPGREIAFVGGTQQGGTYGYGVVHHLDVSAGVATFATL